MYNSETKIKVRFAETDKTGYVHYSNYSNYLDIAQQEFLEKYGTSLDELENRGFRILPISTSFNYHNPILSSDTVTVKLCLNESKSIRVGFEFRFENEKGMLIAEGKASYVAMDMNKGRIAAMRSVFPMFYN